MSQPFTAEESAAIDAFHAGGGKVVECSACATSCWIKFKSPNDEQFSGWELDGWIPGEMLYPEVSYMAARPVYDTDDWKPRPNMKPCQDKYPV